MKLLEGMKTRLKDISKSYELNPHRAEIIIPAFSSKISHGSEKMRDVEEHLNPPAKLCGIRCFNDPISSRMVYAVHAKATLVNLQ